MKKILVPVDSEKPCPKTMEMATEFAQKYEAEIIVLHINHMFEPMSHPYAEIKVDRSPEAYDNYMKFSQKLVETSAAIFRSAGIKVSTKVIKGNAAAEICDYAEEAKCDLIMMCSHGHSATRRFLLGSVTSKVVHHAKVPVMIIR